MPFDVVQCLFLLWYLCDGKEAKQLEIVTIYEGNGGSMSLVAVDGGISTINGRRKQHQ